MSELETKTIEKPTVEETKPTLLDINVALVIAERDDAIRKLAEACDTIEDLRKKIAIAEALIEEDVKAGVINDISPKTSLDKKILGAMSLEKLLEWKKVLDVALIPAFKSGTPVSYQKDNPRKKLNSMFDEAQKKRKEGKN